MVRGEIWWASLPTPRKSEPGLKHPVLIIQADSFNKSNINTVICAVITSNLNLSSAPGNILIHKNESNLPKQSVINISQIITLDKSFLIECVGTVPKSIINELNCNLKMVLSLL